MSKYFDKTFFKFLFGFVSIIGASFLILVAVGFYQVEMKGNQVHASTDLSGR